MNKEDTVKILLSWNEYDEPVVLVKYNDKMAYEIEGESLELANKVATHAFIDEIDGEIVLSSKHKRLYNGDVDLLYDKDFYIAASQPGTSSVMNTISDIVAGASHKNVFAKVLLLEQGKLPIFCNKACLNDITREKGIVSSKEREEVFEEIRNRVFSREPEGKRLSL